VQCLCSKHFFTIGVHPSSGSRILLSDFNASSQGLLGINPAGVSVYAVKCGGLPATIIGNSFDNTIIGTAGRDIIHGLGGGSWARPAATP
jgi:hypothetical protein